MGVVEAVTGAGKTTLGAEVAVQKVTKGEVDLVIVLTPSDPTRKGWLDKFNEFPGVNAEADKDALAEDTNVWVSTYSGWKPFHTELKNRLKAGQSVLAVFDEYHHAEHSAEWGKPVNSIGATSKHALFLSGTPWRREGKIALLADATNWKGEPYYADDETGRVQADITWTYADDLASPNGERATVPAIFDFVPSTAKSEGGVVDVLYDAPPTTRILATGEEVPYTPEEIEAWYDEARVYDRPLGKHFYIEDSRLLNNQTIQRILTLAATRLEESRRRIHNAGGPKDASVMLVVCKSIPDAKSIADYIQEQMQLSCEVITSEDARSSDKLEAIKEQCKIYSAKKPDVIVSVGMISEGVDIPQIKVIAYMSAILTLLYIIQVAGRAFRRMRWNNAWLDKHDVHDTPAYIIAPGHPKLMYVAKKIEKQIEEALGISKIEKVDKVDGGVEKPSSQKYEVTSDGAVHTMFRGSEALAEFEALVTKLVEHPDASDNFLDDDWQRYITAIYTRGSDRDLQRAKHLIEAACKDLGLDLQELLAPPAKFQPGVQPYSVQNKLLRKEAQQLTNRIRFGVEPFKSMDDDGLAFAQIRSRINNAVGMKVGFPKATLQEKAKWIDVAKQVLARGEEVDE